MKRLLVRFLALACLLEPAAVALGDAGSTLTPDRLSYLVNKDIGSQRWTIGLNLAPSDPSIVTNVTGNVFQGAGAPVSFIVCQVRPDSMGTLNDPTSTFRFTCSGADACDTTASLCQRNSWQVISNDLQIGADFFLPPQGNGGSSGTTALRRSPSLGDQVLSLADWLWPGSGRLLVRLPHLALPDVASAFAQAASRGATESYDQLSFLVSKDIGGERWSISLNLAPVPTSAGTTTNQIVNVTGNVYKSDGSTPSFVYCSVNSDSQGTLDDPSSTFSLSCLGTDACQTSASDCAANAWSSLGNVDIAASFFLPPQGLPATPESDPEIVIIGNTSDPASIASASFTTSQGASAAGGPAGLQTCNEGAACFLPTIGSCSNVQGKQTMNEQLGCLCVVDVPEQCVTCGAGATGACGDECEFPVGASGAKARGTCLPATSDSLRCSCRALPPGQSKPSEGCGGPLDAPCPSQRCCADDPSDGCDPAGGGVHCAGVCVDSGSCDPSKQSCGICFGPTEEFCGDKVREGAEMCDGSDFGGRSCGSLSLGSGQLKCTPSCRIDTSGCSGASSCGNGVIDGNEQCDGSDLGDQTCGTLGFLTGTLRCSTDCTFDTSGCSGSGPTPNPCMTGTCQ